MSSTLFRALLALVAMLGVSNPAGAQPPDGDPGADSIFEAPAEPVDIPVHLETDQPVVEVSVHGEGPYRFLVDTGAAGFGRLSQELVERYHLAPVGRVRTGDPSGRNMEERPVYRVAEIRLGDLTATGVPMLASAGIRELDGVDGILGFALFRDLLLTLDYPHRRLRLESGELPPADGMQILENRSTSGIVTVPITVAGRTMDADLDSGSPGFILLPAAVAANLEFASEPRVVGKASTGHNTFEIHQASLRGTIQLGSQTVQNPLVDYADMFPRANLGGQFLGAFAVTCDQKSRRIRLRRADDASLQAPVRYRIGVMLAQSPDGLAVDDVVPGGPADRAGLRKGDRILEINGKALSEIEPGEMKTIFGRPEVIVITLGRGDERVTARLTPEAS